MKWNQDIGTSMWFWSVSLADQLSGQFLVFLVSAKKIVQSQRQDNFFVDSLEFFCPVFFENWSPSNQRLDKKIKKVDKKTFCWLTPKNEKLTGQLVRQETDQNHMNVPYDFIFFRDVDTLLVHLLQRTRNLLTSQE